MLAIWPFSLQPQTGSPKRVEFRGELMSFNEWGCKATGWTAIQIYKWAVLPDGRLLEALREPETDPNNNKEGK